MDFYTKRRTGILTIMAYLIIFYLLASLITTIVVDVIKTDNRLFETSVCNLVIYTILIIPLIIINYKEIIIDFKKLKEKKKPILIILASFGIFYTISIVTNFLVSEVETYANIVSKLMHIDPIVQSTSENQNSIVAMLQGDAMIPMIIAAAIIGPICEELVFRKAFFNICKTKEMGIFLSSLCFGLIHITSSIALGHNFLSIFLMSITYVSAGVAFGIIYIKNDCNILVPTIVHMLGNTISIIGVIYLT